MRSLKIEAPFFGVAQRQSAWLLTRSSGVLISPLEPLRPEHWEVAQLAERRALDAEAAGSSPAFPAKFYRGMAERQGDGLWNHPVGFDSQSPCQSGCSSAVERCLAKAEIVGSIPIARSTI